MQALRLHTLSVVPFYEPIAPLKLKREDIQKFFLQKVIGFSLSGILLTLE